MRAGLREPGCRAASSPSAASPSESELQIALIALFSEMLYRFPNMVVAQVTRESVQQAIASGITAQQVAPPGSVAGRRGARGLCGPLREGQHQVCCRGWCDLPA